MPRPPRNCTPGIPVHIVQRGSNRQKCFFLPSDFVRYLGYLAESATRYDVRVHAYVLMTNHIHLLVTPGQALAVSKMMQRLAGRYAQVFNRVYERTGSVWGGRFRSFPIANESYLLACYRYIELNPVRAGLVESPGEYPWSSFRTNALGATNNVVKARNEWVALGDSKEQRCRAYRQLFEDAFSSEMLAEIGASIKSGSDPGSDPGCG